MFNVIRIDNLVWASHNDKHDIPYAAMDTIYWYGYHLSIDEENLNSAFHSKHLNGHPFEVGANESWYKPHLLLHAALQN